MLALAAMVNGIYQNNGMAGVLKTTVSMNDAAHALVYGKAASAQTQVTGPILLIDAESAGASETLTLPAEANSNGAMFLCINTGGEEVVINDDGASLVTRLRVGGRALLACDGTSWYAVEGVASGGLTAMGVTTVAMNDATHTLTLDAAGAAETQLTGNLVFADPESGGANENLVLPAEADSSGLMLVILNTGGEGIVVQDDTPAAVITLDTAQCGIVACDGTTWYGFMGAIT